MAIDFMILYLFIYFWLLCTVLCKYLFWLFLFILYILFVETNIIKNVLIYPFLIRTFRPLVVACGGHCVAYRHRKIWVGLPRNLYVISPEANRAHIGEMALADSSTVSPMRARARVCVCVCVCVLLCVRAFESVRVSMCVGVCVCGGGVIITFNNWSCPIQKPEIPYFH